MHFDALVFIESTSLTEKDIDIYNILYPYDEETEVEPYIYEEYNYSMICAHTRKENIFKNLDEVNSITSFDYNFLMADNDEKLHDAYIEWLDWDKDLIDEEKNLLSRYNEDAIFDYYDIKDIFDKKDFENEDVLKLLYDSYDAQLFNGDGAFGCATKEDFIKLIDNFREAAKNSSRNYYIYMLDMHI